MSDEFDLKDLERRMDGAVEALKKEFTGLRTGRATTSMLDPVKVNAYGAATPLNQVASVAAPEARLLTVTVWDQGLTVAVEKAIIESNLGLNPQRDGNLLRIPIPEMNEERRQEIAKVAKKYAEDARIAVRNVRRDGMDALKKQEKDKLISEDELKTLSDKVQKLTDNSVQSIDDTLAHKEKDIMAI